MIKVRNRWNCNIYMVVKVTDKEVTLRREDKSEFTISKSEFLFGYREL